ncbi:MAG: hypothetical protein K1X86_15760 [Ignavibacteria bacterium]|nr:hypothetical protein [Ignavibacteria bacterium]
MRIIFAILCGFILLISGCSSESHLVQKYERIYEPVKDNGMIMYYISGFAFGAYSTDKYSIIFNVQPAFIFDQNFLTFWLLYKNTDDKEYLLDPSKIIKMTAWKNGVKKYEIKPESPIALLEDIEESKQEDIVSTAIIGAFKSLNAKTEKEQENTIDKTERKIENIRSWYDLFSESINDKILRKNTIFKDKSVNGLVYFYSPFGPYQRQYTLHGQTYNVENRFNFSEYEIRVSILLPDGMKEIKFKNVAGE